MAQQRRPTHRVSSAIDTTLVARRKLQARRGPHSRRRVFTIANSFPQPSPDSHASLASSGSPPPSSRAVLIPLQFNLRRLPSRLFLEPKEDMHDVVTTGSKRKRVVSGSENALGNGRSSRAGSRAKRRRAMQDTSDEDVESSMEIDTRTPWELTDSEGDADDVDSSDSYLINSAEPRQLLRLRKDELVQLYQAAGLTEDAELLTKHEIVDCIMAARDDLASLPPSSPPIGDSGSSDYSSDGGNVAGGEETDLGHRFGNGLRRRNTVHDLGRGQRPPTERCYSLPQIQSIQRFPRLASQTLPKRRAVSRASSSRSSPAVSSTSTKPPSPPVTRTRSRKLSNDHSTTSTSSIRSKGKGKQVEFNDVVQINSLPEEPEQESDLTDLTELEESISQTNPSPRRLRSKGEREKIVSRNGADKSAEDAETARRVVPMRSAKRRVGSLKEEDTEEEDEEDELQESDAEETEEEDQLIETPTQTPKANKTRRTPLRRRLRPRRNQPQEPSSDGDDEGDDEGSDADATVEESDEGDEGGDERGDDAETVCEESEAEELEDPFVLEPRVLRNGKVVGEDDEDEDEDAIGEDDVDEEDMEQEFSEEGEIDDGDSQVQDDASIDLDAEAEVEGHDTDEHMEDDIDLTVATAKTLVRLRRDDLVRLCEYRDLEASGTKPQLAEALLQWRDKHCSEASSPSSTGTARPPSTTRPRRRKTRSSEKEDTSPVLLRSERVHLDEPRTPPLSERNKEMEPELELDLEMLGLDDREIPPEKLTKLEKIGSGGFKDVFIGRFKGRKVAIAEFRGQLNAMDIKELKLLGDFDHPNIVRFLGVSIPANTRETPVMIVSELCSNGDLFDYIRNVDPPTVYRALCIMLDIARGLEYLHTRKPSVIHRDCKSSNILITSKGVAKITDFGLAKVKQSTRSMMRSLVGTVNWQAPELWHAHPKYNHKVDVFSCGMVFWEILQWHVPNKKFPWEGMNEHAIYEAVGSKHQRPSVHGLRSRWCPEIVDLIEAMWAQESQARPAMSDVVRELEHLVQEYR